MLATAGVAPGDRGLAGGLLAASQQVGAAITACALAGVLLLLPAPRPPQG